MAVVEQQIKISKLERQVSTVVLMPNLSPEASSSITPEPPQTPREVGDETPPTSKSWTAPSTFPTRQPQAPIHSPTPAKTEPRPQVTLRCLEVTTPPPDGMKSSGGLGDAPDSGGNAEPIPMPTVAGDRHVVTNPSLDDKRENQLENVVERLLGLDSARRSDLPQPAVAVKPAPAPAPAPQKASGWGPWGTSLNVAASERSPSPGSLPVKPKAPSQPPKSQPAGFGQANKPAWGAVKTGPTPISQKSSTGPAWGAKPASSSGGTGWGRGNAWGWDEAEGKGPEEAPKRS